MMAQEHYDDDTLIAFLDDGELAGSDAHLRECDSCSEALEEYRAIAEPLHDEAVWDARPLNETPSAGTIAVLRAFAERTALENATAAKLVDELLAGPRENWKPRLDSAPHFRTGGMVRALIAKADDLSGKNLGDALEAVSLAVEIAEALDPSTYPGDTVVKLRGDAWHEKSYVLVVIGDVPGARKALAAAESWFESAAVADYELARLRISRSNLLRAADEFDGSVSEARAARSTFATFGDTRRLLSLQMAEAATLYHVRDFRRSLAIWLEAERSVSRDDSELPGIFHNIAVCYRELRQFDDALVWYGRAVEEFKRIGATAHLVRTRWNIGRTLLAQERWADAESVLRSVIVDFAQVGMREDVTIASLDLAEILLVQGKEQEVGRLCQTVIDDLRVLNLEHTERALLAVSYLQETLERRRATPSLVVHVREYVERTRREPALLFAPPPL